MKKYLFFAAAAAVAMTAACSKSEPKVELPDELQYPEEEVTSPTPILFSSNVRATAGTKAQGPVTEWNSDMSLSVYGFAVDVTGNIKDIANPLVNAEASAPASGTNGAIAVYEDAEAQTPYYYAARSIYRFYGYYDDGAADSEPSAEAGVWSVPVTIDGGQDIMVATSDPEADLETAKTAAEGDADLTAELATIEAQYKNIIYSEYTARRNIVPSLVFKHQLVRFDFEIVAGNQDVIDNNVQITAIQFENVYNTGTLTIAPEQSLAATGEPVTLSLKEKGEDGSLVDLNPKTPGLAAETLGSSLMLFPAESYSLVYTLVQNGQEVTSSPISIDPSMFQSADDAEGVPARDAFYAGYRYVITLTVLGLEEIEISVDLEQWNSGGNYELDPEDPSVYE